MNKFWDIRMAKDKPKIGEMLIYGPITSTQFWGDEVTPATIKQELDNLGDIEELNIYINSNGGSVFSGQAIYNILKRHSAQKIVYVDGLAASIASVIAMVGDKRIMPKNAMLMVHNAAIYGASGNAKDFRKLADNLDLFSNLAVEIYKEKTGQDESKLIELMDAETWLTADMAKELGFIDEIEESKEIAASINGDFLMMGEQQLDISQYKNKPDIKVNANNQIIEFLPRQKQQKPEQKPEPETVKDDQVDENLVSLYQKQIDLKKSKFKYHEGGKN